MIDTIAPNRTSNSNNSINTAIYYSIKTEFHKPTLNLTKYSGCSMSLLIDSFKIKKTPYH